MAENLEEPTFTLVQAYDDFEVRAYSPRSSTGENR